MKQSDVQAIKLLEESVQSENSSVRIKKDNIQRRIDIFEMQIELREERKETLQKLLSLIEHIDKSALNEAYTLLQKLVSYDQLIKQLDSSVNKLRDKEEFAQERYNSFKKKNYYEKYMVETPESEDDKRIRQEQDIRSEEQKRIQKAQKRKERRRERMKNNRSYMMRTKKRQSEEQSAESGELVLEIRVERAESGERVSEIGDGNAEIKEQALEIKVEDAENKNQTTESRSEDAESKC